MRSRPVRGLNVARCDTATKDAMAGPSRVGFLTGMALAVAAAGAASGQQLAVVRATSAIDDPAVPYLYAMQSGLFKRYGIDASIERSTSGAAAASAVVGGTFEVGKASTISFLNAFSHGLPIIALAPGGEFDPSRPNAQLAVAPDSPIKNGADFRGKTIAVSALNDMFTLAVWAWIDLHGGDSSTAKLVELPTSAAVQAVSSGRVDAAVVVEPFFSQARTANQVKSIGDVAGALGTRHTDSLWFTTLAYTKANADTVDRFIRAMRDAAVYVNSHPAETAPLLVEFAKVTVTDVNRLRVLQGTRLSLETLQPILDAAYKYGMIAKRTDAKDIVYAGALR